MDVTPLIPVGRQVIEDYGAQGFRVSGTEYEGAVLVFPDYSRRWTVGGFATLDADSFAPVLSADPRPEILLLGCGSKMLLFPSALRRTLREAGIVVEAMDTGAACRTYNVLMGEGRRVAAALLPL